MATSASIGTSSTTSLQAEADPSAGTPPPKADDKANQTQADVNKREKSEDDVKEDDDHSDATAKDAKKYSLPKETKRGKKRRSTHASKGKSDAPANKIKRPKKSTNKAASGTETNKTDDSLTLPKAQVLPPTNTDATLPPLLSIEMILEGVDGGPYPCGTVTLNPNIGKTDANANNLFMRGILTTNDGDPAKPILVSFTAFWGEYLTLPCLAQPDTLARCVKLQLAHDHPVSDYFEENYVALASRMTLLVDGDKELDDDKPIGTYMIVGTSTGNPFPNEISIRVEGKKPPTLSINQVLKLARACEKANFRIGARKVFPGVIKITDNKHDLRHGFPILVLSGDEKSVRTAIWIAPTKRVTRHHNGADHVYVNLAALTLKLCYKNDVPVKIKYQDNLTTYYMVNVANVRLYQDTNIRDSDARLLNQSNFLPGYTYRIANPSTPKTPCRTGHWDIFPAEGIRDVDKNGNLTMAYTEDESVSEVAFNKNNEARYGDTMDDDEEVSVATMVEWWKPLAAAFRLLAERMRHSEIEPFPTASRYILHTCSNLQLGRLCYTLRRFLDMASEDKKLIRPGRFRTDLSDAIHDVVAERLDNWDHYKYMTSSSKLRQGSCVFTCNDLNSLKPDKRMKYYHLAQLMQYLSSSFLDEYDNSDLLRSLRTLQRDGFLGTGETPVPRYIPTAKKYKKEKTKKNPDTINKFMRQ